MIFVSANSKDYNWYQNLVLSNIFPFELDSEAFRHCKKYLIQIPCDIVRRCSSHSSWQLWSCSSMLSMLLLMPLQLSRIPSTISTSPTTMSSSENLLIWREDPAPALSWWVSWCNPRMQHFIFNYVFLMTYAWKLVL